MIDIASIIRQSPGLPALPKVVHELIETLSNDSVSADSIAQLISADVVISAKVLRLANSAYFGAPKSIVTIHDAVKLLGIDAVRNCVLSASMTNSFKSVPGLDIAQFWRYSFLTAIASKHLAKVASADTSLAFIGGLLHGLGRLVMQSTMNVELLALAGISPFPTSIRHHMEKELYGFSYADVGCELALFWNFPDEIASLICAAADPAGCKLGAVVNLASWRAAGHAEELSFDALADAWPADVGHIAGLSRPQVLDDMPPLSELSAGMETILT